MYLPGRGDARVTILVIVLCCIPVVHAAEAVALKRGTAQQIHPGIWRVRLGAPEKFTPVSVNPIAVKAESLAVMQSIDTCPLSLQAIRFEQTTRGCHVELPASGTEQFFGLGMHMPHFNITGMRKNIVVSDYPEALDGSGHAPVPFYVSTAGYGVFADTLRYARFYMGNLTKTTGATGPGESDKEVAISTEQLYKAREGSQKNVTVDIPTAAGVDIYIFAGPTMQDAVRRYILFSGGGAVPPLWGLGIYYRGYGRFNADQVLSLARYFREKHMPCSVFGLEPGWHSHAYSCSFVWSDRYPDPDAFLKEMSDMGYQVNLWEHAFVHPTAPFYESIKPYCGNYEVWGGLVPDFLMPQAQRIFSDYHEREFVRKGINSFKLDECDNQPWKEHPWSFPEIAHFPSGLDGEQMHSIFGLAYQRTLTEMFHRNNIRTWSQVRASHGLAAASPFVLYSDAYDHRHYVRAILNAGFVGLLWQPELRTASSVEDLLHRVGTMVCSPQALVNAWFMPHPGWHQIDEEKNRKHELMPDRDAIEDKVRELFELRMSLIPYLYAAFMEYHEKGIPPFRALVMDYPQDEKTYKLDDEYMMGPSILVAPIFGEDTSRKVYLPQGQWHCFWTGREFTGSGEYTIEMPPERIPLFVKDNTLLPLADPVEYITRNTVFDITVRVYGSSPAEFALYEDDGFTCDYEQGHQNRILLSWESTATGHIRRTGCFESRRYNIIEWEKRK